MASLPAAVQQQHDLAVLAVAPALAREAHAGALEVKDAVVQRNGTLSRQRTSRDLSSEKGREERPAGRVLGGARGHADVVSAGLVVGADPPGDVTGAADRAHLCEKL